MLSFLLETTRSSLDNTSIFGSTLDRVRGPRLVDVLPQSLQKCWGHLKLPSFEYATLLGLILSRHSCAPYNRKDAHKIRDKARSP